MPARHPTTERLIREGLRLFAENGMAGTPITRIEQAAGLSPGSGAFYKHFRSKQQLYAAAVDDTVAEQASEARTMPPGLDVETEARLIAGAALARLDSLQDLLLVTMREREPFPAGHTFESAWPADGHVWFAGWLKAKHQEGVLEVNDPDATSVLLLGSLTAFWLNGQRVSEPILGVDRNRFIDAWATQIRRLRPAPAP